MTFIVSSKASPMLLSSQKEVINRPDNSVVINSDSLLLNHYSKTIPYIEQDDIKLSSFYHHDNAQKEDVLEGGSAVEEDTEDEDDDEDLLSSVTTLSETQEQKVCGTTAASLCTGLKAPLSSALPPIQTYSPQLNLSLYSPSITTPVSSVRSKKNRAYPASSLSTFAAPPPSSCFKDTSTVQNPTPISSFINKPLYSTQASSSIASTLKMDIRSPPQPSQSTSRFMNAFQRLRGTSSAGHRHQNVHTNSVVPAEICTVKPMPTKSSLADKIKNKFQQLDKKKRASLQETMGRKNSILSSKRSIQVEKVALPRSTSLSSISHWSSRLTAHKANETAKMTHSESVTSFLSSKSLSRSSSSSSSHSSGRSTPALTLTKSISSHRIYKNTAPAEHRPRQPLRATNPNDSVRLKLGQAKQKKTQVRFTKLVSVKETYAKMDYDRGSDPEAVCTRLTPAMAQQIKEELNAYKLHEMQVHEFSRIHTHFFL